MDGSVAERARGFDWMMSCRCELSFLLGMRGSMGIYTWGLCRVVQGLVQSV
jgi:hypothetical protein